MTDKSAPTGLAQHLLGLDRDELHAFFTETGTVEITGLIRETDDADLGRLVADDGVRDEAVQAILGRFPEFADAERLARIDGVVRFELSRRSGPTEHYTVRIAGGGLTLLAGGAPDVTIGADVLDFVRLVTGQRNAALLYLSDRLAVKGDERLALDVGTVFTVPGTDGAAVDPTALDAVDVATAVAGTSAAHLREVMGGGFRPVVMDEVCRRFPDFLDPDKAARMRLSVGFRVGGRADGGADRFVVHVDHGLCRVETDPPEGERRDATIVADGVDFLRLAMGQLNPVAGVLKGTLKVRGDKAKALALNAIMRPPQPRPATRPAARR